MANAEINEGRGFPLAKEGDAPVTIAPHRTLLFQLIQGALRSEYGVINRQAQRAKSDYYAGRRAGFVASAAQLIATLYGEDYEEAKTRLSLGIRSASAAASTPEDLVDPLVSEPMSISIAEFVLSR